MSSELIDAHQHVWLYSQHQYSWITPDIIPLLGHDYRQSDIAEIAKKIGITGTVYIQAADTYEDTFAMLDSAQHSSSIVGIVGWVPLHRTSEAVAALDLYRKNLLFKGVRNLTHDYGNPVYESDDRWILRPSVVQTLREVAARNMTLDYVATKPEHVVSISLVAEQIPDLKIVVDHFAKPDIKNHQWEDWLAAMQSLAKHQNVFTKFSGLNVLCDWEKWTIEDWRPYLMAMLETFTSERMMTGGDWPFSSMANDFETVWNAQLALIAELPELDQENIKFRTAQKFYSLGENK